jgi:omega-amidase
MPSPEIKISLIQSHLHWENPDANRAMFEEKIWSIGEKTDIIVLPEMFTTGFSLDVRRLAEPTGLHTFRWMKQMAQQTGAVITGSYMVSEGEKFYNRLLWAQPDGNVYQYDKRHLFRMADEHLAYQSGEKQLVVNWKGWNFCPLICYDLRFPIWSRNSADLKYDCLIYVANWPKARSLPWSALLKARAIENWSYCVGVNRVGEDGNQLAYSGDSAVISPKGETLFEQKDEEIIRTLSLNYSELQEYRQKFPAYLDADAFELK